MGMSPARLAAVARVVVACNMQDARRRAGLTQIEAARCLDWDQSKLSRLENGFQPVTVDELALMALVYKVPFSHLVNVS